MYRGLDAVLAGGAPSRREQQVDSDVRAAFRTFDTDGSGTLTKDECMDFCHGLAVSRNYLEGVWAVYDSNGDGTLDRREFASLYAVLMTKHDAVSPRPDQQPQTQQNPLQQPPPPQPEQRRQGQDERYAAPPPGSSRRGSVKSSNAAFESEAPRAAPAGGVSWGDDFEPAEQGSYWREVARRSRAGDGSGPIIAVSTAILAVMIALVLILWSYEDPKVDPPALGAGDGSGPAEEEEENLWYIGVAMSCVACLANAFGYNLVRRAHTLVQERLANGEEEAKVMDHWQFPVGWACSILICAVLDAVALSFTDPALIAPLSGFTLVLNVWVAQWVNNEEVFAIDGAITALILSGVVTTISSGPAQNPPKMDAEYLWSHVFRPGFLIYEFVVHTSAIVVYQRCRMLYGDQTEAGIAAGRAANPRLNTASPLMYPWVGAVYTAHMNISVAALLNYLKGAVLH